MAKRTKMEEITDEKWSLVDSENRKIVEEYLEQSIQLSDHTLKQYTSALRIFFYWIYENAGNKKFYEIKSKDFLFYQNYLSKIGMSSSGIRLKRSAVSSLNNYIEVFYQDEYPMFRNYINKGIPTPKQKFINKKEPLTMEEYNNLCSELEKRELWQHLAYLKFSFSSGARRSEVAQLLKDVVNYEPKIKTISVLNDGVVEERVSKYYLTHNIRCKGSSKEGKIRQLAFDEEAMEAIKKWIAFRGEDNCEYVFISGSGDTSKKISVETFNFWCRTIFEEIVGRRVHPHLIRETRATTLVVEQGKDIEVAKKLLGHESSATTEIYVIRDEEDNADEAFI